MNQATTQPTSVPAGRAAFIRSFMADLEGGRVKLPTLPEVALKVRRVIDDPNSDNNDLELAISSDPAIAARLVRVANSALYAGMVPVPDLRSALIRLGRGTVQNLVNTVVLRDLFQPGQAQAYSEQAKIQPILEDTWNTATEVAGIASMLARQYTRLSADVAALAGLLHNIGRLPILMRAVNDPYFLASPTELSTILRSMSPEVGRVVVETWRFPRELVTAVTEHEHIHRDSGSEPDYADLVIAARLLIAAGHDPDGLIVEEIPAFRHLGFASEQAEVVLEDAQTGIAEFRAALA